MKTLFEPVRIGPITAKNRICVPPMVLYGHAQGDGLVTEAHIRHYAALAHGGAGLIIQEATCISPEGMLRGDQLGIWSDGHIPGLRRITEAVHRENCPIFVQLHHAGIVGLGETCLCPDAYRLTTKDGVKTGKKMTRSEIHRVRDAFIQGAVRAKQAGYDGVELHGCHSYLLCQFLNPRVNRRTDEYGASTYLVTEIMAGIRAATGPDFVLGIRLGAFEPTLREGLEHAKALSDGGIDFLDISYGFAREADTTAPGNPALLDVIRAAGEIKKQVAVPVFAVNGIRAPDQAELVLRETQVDMVDIGRSCLVDPEWPNKAAAGMQPGMCLGCQVCQWRIDSAKCPGRRMLRTSET